MTGAVGWSRRFAGIVALLISAASGSEAVAQASGTIRGAGEGDTLIDLSSASCPATASRPDDTPLRTYGRADYAWALETLAGDTLTLARLRGKVLFINMWATWCPPCIAELASIERLAASLTTTADSAIAMLLITPERRATVVPFVRRRALTSPVYLERKRTPAAWGLFGLPTSYIVARDGNIVLHHRGATRWDTDDVRGFLRALACR